MTDASVLVAPTGDVLALNTRPDFPHLCPWQDCAICAWLDGKRPIVFNGNSYRAFSFSEAFREREKAAKRA